MRRVAGALTALLGVILGMLAPTACSPPSQAPAPPTPPPLAGDDGWRRGVCGTDGWCWGYPRPQGMRLNRLWGTSADDLWAVGDGGAILKFDGKAWSRVRSGTTDTLVAVSGRARGDAWAAGRERTLLRLRDGAWTTWAPAADGGAAARPPASGEFRDLVALPNGEAWVVGGADRGAGPEDDPSSTGIMGRFAADTWLFDEDPACAALVQVWGRAPDDVWARGGGDVVHWNGRNLIKNPRDKAAPLVGRHGTAGGWRLQIDWGSGTAGTLFHQEHTPKAEQAPRARDFWAFGAADVWSLRGDGSLAHFDGRGWENGDIPLQIKDVAARGPDDVWAAATPSTLLHYDGRAWHASPIPGNGAVDPAAIGVASANDIWVLAGNKILRFDPRQRSWSQLTPPTAGTSAPRPLTALMVLGPNDVWIGADRQALHWNGRSLDVHEIDSPITSLWGNANEIWAGPPAQRWNGNAFVAPPELAGIAKAPDAGAAKDAGGAWVGAAGPGAIWLVRGGTIARLAAGRLETVGTPTTGNRPVSLRAIWQSSGGDVWAVGSHIVHGTSDAAGAMTWTIEDSAGLTDMTKVGGARELIWVRGAQGILFRRDVAGAGAP